MFPADFYGVSVGHIDASRPPAVAEMLAVFEFLKPKNGTIPLVRIGEERDGAYLVPDALAGIQACFSPGVNRIKYFEDHLATMYGIVSHMCDFSCSVDQFKTPLIEGLQTFQRKWLDPELGDHNISLDAWVDLAPADSDLLLQIDIEGAEYRNLLATSEETLSRFRIVVAELHGLGRIRDARALRGAIVPFVEKLKRHFTCVHAHPNNCCGQFRVPGTEVDIPNVIEVTLLRNDHFEPADSLALIPHPLDVGRNVPANPPIFLSDAWIGGDRPAVSRIKMLGDEVAYLRSEGPRRLNAAVSATFELACRSTADATLDATRIIQPADKPRLTQVAHECSYELSSGFGGRPITGTVTASDSFFFHTKFGRDQFICVDLGCLWRVYGVEFTNRPEYRDRARATFVFLSDIRCTGYSAALFVAPMLSIEGDSTAPVQCAATVPGVYARYVTITSPMETALHFADLRVYARDESGLVARLGSPFRP